ncbi:hypothetical protein MMC20_000908 [Loxospora ochrophaea]|nr:hypothetical protein [Loxospora ochrophaea]
MSVNYAEFETDRTEIPPDFSGWSGLTWGHFSSEWQHGKRLENSNSELFNNVLEPLALIHGLREASFIGPNLDLVLKLRQAMESKEAICRSIGTGAGPGGRKRRAKRNSHRDLMLQWDEDESSEHSEAQAN